MNIISDAAVGCVAILHLYFMILEIFIWEKPFGLKTFGMTPEFAKTTKVLASNQGIYNGFLFAGLVWGLIQGSAGFQIKLFFLGCVIIAGLFGGFTASRKILWIQALPGAVALLLLSF
jgi:putative membrane protein